MTERTRPVAVVDDEDLLDDLLRVAAAAGCELERAPDIAAIRGRWARAPLIVLDDEAAAGCEQASLPRRSGVVLVARGVPPPALFERGVAVGAERVVGLPAAEPWLAGAFADAVEGPADDSGRILAVVGGRGGAGASTFAAAVGSPRRLGSPRCARTVERCLSIVTQWEADSTSCWEPRPSPAFDGPNCASAVVG